MTRVLHISDTHFGTERPDVVEALVALAGEQAPELVVLGGDITQRARRAQFDAAARFAARLGAPVLAVPGNHDIPLFNLLARWRAPYGGYRRAFGDALEPVYESPALLAIGVNSTRPARRKDGEVSPEQVRRVAGRLRAAAPSQLRLVVAHHPVRAIVGQDRVNLLHGHRAAVAAWAAAGADLLLGGHIHLPYVRALGKNGENAQDGPHIQDAPSAWAVQAGTAVSRRVRGAVPNSVNLIVWDPSAIRRACRVERWDCPGGGRPFERAGRHELPLRPAIPPAATGGAG